MTAAFVAAIQERLGAAPPLSAVTPGKFLRFPTSDHHGDDSGWCRLFEDGEGGVFGCWRQGVSETWQTRTTRTSEKRVAFAEKVRKAQEEAKRQEEARRKRAGERARKLWQKATAAAPDHPYLLRKGVKPTPTLRELPANDVAAILGYTPQSRGENLFGRILIAPVKIGDAISTCELVDGAGRKSAIAGGAKAGGYWAAQPLPEGDGTGLTFCVGEGVATVLSVQEATAFPVLAALCCSNLPTVAKAMRKQYPAARVVIVSDRGNGEKDAAEAAEISGGTLVLPVFHDSGSWGTDMNDLHAEEGLEEVRRQIEEAETPPVDQRRSRFISAVELLTQRVSVSYLIDKVIEEHTFGQMFGPSGGGKTFQVLHMALCIATGTPWNGHRVKTGMVLYLAGEGHGGLSRRVLAWAKREGKTADELGNFHVSRNTIGLDFEGVADVIREAQDLASGHGATVALLVVDTLARHIEGDENATRDMGGFIKAVNRISGHFPGCTALIVHHTGNGEESRGRSRGSSALRGACDFEIRCDQGTLTFTKMKDAADPDPIPFKLLPVEVGRNEDGEPITSCVVEFGERAAKYRTADLTPTEKELLSIIRDTPGILVGDLRSTFYEKRKAVDPEEKANTLKNAFLRGYRGLIDKGVVSERENVVNLIPDTPSQRHNTVITSQCDGGQGSRHTSHTPYRECDAVTLAGGAADGGIPVFSEEDLFGEVVGCG